MDQKMNELEEGKVLTLDWNKLAKVAAACPDVIPAAIQDAGTMEVILVAYLNERALKEMLASGILTLWSTSRNELWVKGKTSGNSFSVVEIRVNCEQNSLLIKVRPQGDAICHTRNQAGKSRNCYYRILDTKSLALNNSDP
jgi:phosphoribosyl-AMP cyclohydrolase